MEGMSALKVRAHAPPRIRVASPGTASRHAHFARHRPLLRTRFHRPPGELQGRLGARAPSDQRRSKHDAANVHDARSRRAGSSLAHLIGHGQALIGSRQAGYRRREDQAPLGRTRGQKRRREDRSNDPLPRSAFWPQLQRHVYRQRLGDAEGGQVLPRGYETLRVQVRP